MSDAAVLEGLELLNQGKVRDIYAAGEDRLLLVTTDRVSTYDVIHPTPIPDKGKVLTGLSAFWFARTQDIVPNHVISYTDVPEDVKGRSILAERLEMAPVECVVRGYITGSGWKDYQASGAICGIELPDGLEESQQLPGADLHARRRRPTWATTTRTSTSTARPRSSATARCSRSCGGSRSSSTSTVPRTRARTGSSSPTRSSSSAVEPDGTIVLGDEALTPDSSRFWPATGYKPGGSQPSFDKQYVRDWATELGWDKSPPAPPIPSKVIDGTRARYIEAYERIAGEPFSKWLERSGAA